MENAPDHPKTQRDVPCGSCHRRRSAWSRSPGWWEGTAFHQCPQSRLVLPRVCCCSRSQAWGPDVCPCRRCGRAPRWSKNDSNRNDFNFYAEFSIEKYKGVIKYKQKSNGSIFLLTRQSSITTLTMSYDQTSCFEKIVSNPLISHLQLSSFLRDHSPLILLERRPSCRRTGYRGRCLLLPPNPRTRRERWHPSTRWNPYRFISFCSVSVDISNVLCIRREIHLQGNRTCLELKKRYSTEIFEKHGIPGTVAYDWSTRIT